MSFTNSNLATYVRLTKAMSPNRTHAIDTITIHCMAAPWTAKTCCDYFATSGREASSNYCVGYDGSIGMSVQEKDRSWCSSNSENDNRAITIEVASETTHPYKVTDAAYKALIDLVVDICQRNNIESLKWQNNKSLIGQVDKQNMTVHRWFDAKACPGDYLMSKHPDIVKQVNARLGVKATPTVLYKVQVGAFAIKENAEKLLSELKSKGYDGFIVESPVNGSKTESGTNTHSTLQSGSNEPTTLKTSIEEVARAVIRGEWGNGDEREQKLTDAGYDYNVVQDMVNKLLS